jgi:hypothetical protein
MALTLIFLICLIALMDYLMVVTDSLDLHEA